MMNNEEKLRLKRERNKESARESRKRKKVKTDEIRKQIIMMEASNLQLRLQLNEPISSELTSDNNFMKSQIAGKLNKLLKEGASDEEIQETIKQIQEKYSDYGMDRRSAIAFHINQLKRALKPTLTTRTMLWLIKVARPFMVPGSESASTDAADDAKREFFHSLMDELNPSPEQVKKIIEFTDVKQSDDGLACTNMTGMFDNLEAISNDTDAKLNRLDEMVSMKNFCLESEVKELHRILTGKQIAKFIIWVDKNPACMQLLEALWPHLVTETD